MPQVPAIWGEWRPDISLLDNQFARDVENVFPLSSSYVPVPDLVPFTDAIVPPPPLDEPIVGLTSARGTDGTWKVYAGTPTKLYKWTLSGWTDVSRTVGGNYHVAPDARWSFTQFGKWLIAVQAGDVPQAIDVDVGTNFAALGGSPPRAHTVRTIGDFVVLASLVTGATIPGTTVSTSRRQIIWSDINDPTQWTVGMGLCDYQEMPDGGPVMGMAGDKIGYVVQDRSIRVMQFLPGDTTFIFAFSKVVYDRGAISLYGFTSVGDTLYVLCDDGFYALSGAQLIPIGHEKVNDWFLTNSDPGRRNVVQAGIAIKPYVTFAYHGSTGSPAYYDRVILFNWSNQRWSKAAINAQIWATLATVDLDLDTTGPEAGDALLDSTARSLDSFAYMGGRPKVSAINPDGYLSELAGPNLPATLETAELHLVPGRRAMVGDVYPLADGAEGVIYDGARERLQDDVIWSQAFPIEVTGSAAVYSSARLHRFRHVIPRGTRWTHAQGLLVDAQQDGTVA
jgi:hypothetical protein